MPIINLKNISKIYRTHDIEVKALDNVSFSIEKGEYATIMGPSGSGKSTCMNLIGCLDTPSSGEIYINSVNTSKMSEKELSFMRNREIGFIFQQFNLLNNITVIDNVMLPLLYAGVNVKLRKKRAIEMLERVELKDRIYHYPNELSGGQKQRVAIARALINNPSIILADEPTGALDSHTGHIILDLFKNFHAEGKTIILITHDPEIGANSNRLIHVKDGLIVYDTSNKTLENINSKRIP